MACNRTWHATSVQLPAEDFGSLAEDFGSLAEIFGSLAEDFGSLAGG